MISTIQEDISNTIRRNTMSKIGNYVIDKLEQGETMEEIIEKGVK